MKCGVAVLDDSEPALVMPRVMSVCQGLTDARFSMKGSSTVKDGPTKSGQKVNFFLLVCIVFPKFLSDYKFIFVSIRNLAESSASS